MTLKNIPDHDTTIDDLAAVKTELLALAAVDTELLALAAVEASLAALATKYANSVATYALGTDETTFDITSLACDTKGPFRAVIFGQTVSNSASTVSLRVNASTSNIIRIGMYGDGGAAPTLYGAGTSPGLSLNAANPAAGAMWGFVVEAADVASGRYRTMDVIGWGEGDPTSHSVTMTRWTILFKSTAEITSIGAGSSVAGDIDSLSTARLDRL